MRHSLQTHDLALEETFEASLASLPGLYDIFNTPLQLPDSKNVTTNYYDIPIFESGEKMHEIGEAHGFKGFDRSKLPSPETRTKSIWARESVVFNLLVANMLIKALTANNQPEHGGMLQLRLKDIYKPIEAQRALYKNILEREIKNAGGDVSEGTRIAKILCSDPTGFDENDQSTWALHTPIHATGAAVDTFLWTDHGGGKADITIAGYHDVNGHYNTDYFEKKLLAGEKLDEKEETCLRNRRLLFTVMQAAGFSNYIKEPWHYDYHDQMWAMMERIRGATAPFARYGYVPHPERQRGN